MKKKYICFVASLLSLVMIISSIPVSANSTESTLSSSISIATERAENFLYSVGYQATVNNPLIFSIKTLRILPSKQVHLILQQSSKVLFVIAQ